MEIGYLLVFCLGGLVVGWLLPPMRKAIALLIFSILSLFWLQPSTPIRQLDFWLPTASIGLTGFVWAVTLPDDKRPARDAIATISILACILLGISITRAIEPLCCLTPSRPPAFIPTAIAIILIIVLIAIPFFFSRLKAWLHWLAIITILALFLILKSGALSQAASSILRSASGQSTEFAASLDLPWLGFSFLAFRLLHVLRDSQMKRLPAYSLGDFLTYAIFFPSVMAGPIDRSQHFMLELRSLSEPQSDLARKERKLRQTLIGFQKIIYGVFEKFVLADSLAIFALNAQNAIQTTSTIWMWMILLAYSLRIYFDFSGYTDIAIGLGRLVGIELPGNFDRPYRKTNLTAFWNSWHITLSAWFRSYVFFPLTRMLRSGDRSLPPWFVILTSQLITMSLIGLWHGISWNFLIWGIWHGLGLFTQNRWSEWMKGRLDSSTLSSLPRLGIQSGSWLLTFLYVSLGWVWFALPSPQLTLMVFSKLAGLPSGF